MSTMELTRSGLWAPHDPLHGIGRFGAGNATVARRQWGMYEGADPMELDLNALTERQARQLLAESGRRSPSGAGAERIYQAWNAVAPTTSAIVAVTTGTGLKTMLQIATASTRRISTIEWGISLNGSAAAAPGVVELFGCTGAATVTTLNAADIVKVTNPGDEASTIQLGTSLSGFTATIEGTVAAWRGFDNQHIAPTNQYVKQWPLNREPESLLSTFIRVRVTFASGAVNALCYITWVE